MPFLLLIPLKQHGDLGTFYSRLLRDRVVPETLQTTFFACTPVKTEGLWSPSPAHRWDLTNIMWCCYLTNCKSFNEERWGDISYIPMEIRYFVSRCNDIPVLALRLYASTCVGNNWIRENTGKVSLLLAPKLYPHATKELKEATSSPEDSSRSNSVRGNLKLSEHGPHHRNTMGNQRQPHNNSVSASLSLSQDSLEQTQPHNKPSSL